MSSVKTGNKPRGKKNTASSSVRRAKSTDEYFGKPAFKRLCYAAGITVVGKDLYDNVLLVTDMVCHTLLRSAVASSSLSGRKTLNESDLVFACQANGTPLLSSALNIKRIKIKKQAAKDPDAKPRKSSRNVMSENKVKYYQKESVGTLMFSSTPFVRKFKQLMETRKSEMIFSGDEIPRMNKEFKVLLQLTLQTILIRILSSALISCKLYSKERKSVKSSAFKHAAEDILCTSLNF